MIIPMHKYCFLVYHGDYDNFLHDIQQLGVLHIIEKVHSSCDDIMVKSAIITRIDKTIKFLEKYTAVYNDQRADDDAMKIVEEVAQKQNKLETLNQELITSRKELLNAKPWGDFSTENIHNLSKIDLHVRFFIALKKKFNPQILEKYPIEIINESRRFVYFVLLQRGNEELTMDARAVEPPERSASEVKKRIDEIKQEITRINNELDKLAAIATSLLTKEKDTIQTSMEFDQVIMQTHKKLDDKLMILEGWVPLTRKKQIDRFLSRKKILFIAKKATPKDKAPILLQNNRFSKLFEPIGKLFSLPAYSELDLTVFFAPFFMLFFGFCLGDAGYGLLFIIAAGLYKIKAKKEIKPYLTLIQFLGIATFIIGFISGTFFGINLVDADIKLTEHIKSLYLDSEGMLNLAILLGAAQIVFGLFLKAANQIRQYGFLYALGTFGWLIILIGISTYTLLVNQEMITFNKRMIYLILFLGGMLILFFSDPEAGIFSRIGKGVWNIYATTTGIFGDLLSYIRLFALGLSSAILGFVVNEIALEILIIFPLFGRVFFGIFLLLGHTLNILISSLSSFVHPMRLTFVEFFKNAGFTGGGKAYKPFTRYKSRQTDIYNEYK